MNSVLVRSEKYSKTFILKEVKVTAATGSTVYQKGHKVKERDVRALGFSRFVFSVRRYEFIMKIAC